MTYKEETMKCKICGFEEDKNNKFVGIFSFGQNFATTNREICGIYGCPNCNNVIYTTDKDYIKFRKKEYIDKIKAKKVEPKLKYDKDLYVGCGFYDTGFGEDDISCYKEKLVKCRKPHKCASCEKEIPIRAYAVAESGLIDGSAVSCYTCTSCIEEWLEESGQIEEDEEDI